MICIRSVGLLSFVNSFLLSLSLILFIPLLGGVTRRSRDGVVGRKLRDIIPPWEGGLQGTETLDSCREAVTGWLGSGADGLVWHTDFQKGYFFDRKKRPAGRSKTFI